jgi:hypothetical protein
MSGPEKPENSFQRKVDCMRVAPVRVDQAGGSTTLVVLVAHRSHAR